MHVNSSLNLPEMLSIPLHPLTDQGTWNVLRLGSYTLSPKGTGSGLLHELLDADWTDNATNW